MAADHVPVTVDAEKSPDALCLVIMIYGEVLFECRVGTFTNSAFMPLGFQDCVVLGECDSKRSTKVGITGLSIRSQGLLGLWADEPCVSGTRACLNM